MHRYICFLLSVKIWAQTDEPFLRNHIPCKTPISALPRPWRSVIWDFWNFEFFLLQPSKKTHQRLFQVNGSQNKVLGGGSPQAKSSFH